MPRDERTYITLHDGMPEHPKVEGLSDAAFRLLIEAWCWCSRNRTDGRITQSSWAKRGTPKTRNELVTAGLVDVTTKGVEVHDYTQHQRTAAEIAELSEKRRIAGSKGGKALANARASATANAQANPKQGDSKLVAETETDSPRDTSSTGGARRATRIPDDWKPNAEDVTWQRDAGISDLLARRELPKFGDYWRAKARDNTKLDWSATWRNWLRTAQEREPKTTAATNAAGRRKASTEW